ncbi:plus-3-domain-containing protein [Lentinula boryana]|uniref:Plus-3-domain-containing protein n=1 Tax=Lentinula boryana TaxID=40481 RepID=A0ABQ8QFM7_9AGAR|nr:plus-3-domain-containing protein [Lentinula boryana]
MSDFDDELLELVEADPSKERKRKRSGGSKAKGSHSSKRRKADVSDDDPESEEEEDDPYPLDGKYVDETDMQRLLQLPEIEREDIIATRMEERQKILDKKALALLVKEQRERDRVGDSDGGNAGVAKAAKRQHTARGATKEKTSKLDELKAKRKAKDQKSKNRAYSPKRERSSSPMDMETSSSDEDEDGVITKDEQEEERAQRLMNGGVNSAPKTEVPATLQDLERCRLSRTLLLKHFLAPWFPQYIKGMWVRYLIGFEENVPVYRICQVNHLVEDPVKPYKIEEQWFDRQAELVHGLARRKFNLDQISNSRFTEKEFDRLRKTLFQEDLSFPTRSSIEAKIVEMHRLVSQTMTESDLSSILNKRRELNSKRPPGWTTLERSRLNQARTLASRRQDHAEVAELDAQIAEFDARYGNGGGTNGSANGKLDENTRSSSGSDVLMKLSEKNRKANAEAVRRAEQQEAERKRRERKLAMSGSGTSTPIDPSARLKILPRTLIARTPTPGPSRSGTPAAPTPSKEATHSASPLSGSGKSNGQSFEASVIASLEVDLGDF